MELFNVYLIPGYHGRFSPHGYGWALVELRKLGNKDGMIREKGGINVHTDRAALGSVQGRSTCDLSLSYHGMLVGQFGSISAQQCLGSP